MAKRIALNITKAVAIIAGVVFWFTPLHTGTQLLVFGASIITLIICFAISSNLNDENTGYWPEKPNRPQSGGDTQSKE